jgi:hypothetical protein
VHPVTAAVHPRQSLSTEVMKLHGFLESIYELIRSFVMLLFLFFIFLPPSYWPMTLYSVADLSINLEQITVFDLHKTLGTVTDNVRYTE